MTPLFQRKWWPPKIMHIFYIIIGLKIIKWTVCTHWVRTKITTQSVQHTHWAWPATRRCVNSWVLDAYWMHRMLCVVHFWTHLMHADCSFDYFLPINEQFACGKCIQKYQEHTAKPVSVQWVKIHTIFVCGAKWLRVMLCVVIFGCTYAAFMGAAC